MRMRVQALCVTWIGSVATGLLVAEAMLNYQQPDGNGERLSSAWVNGKKKEYVTERFFFCAQLSVVFKVRLE